MSAPGSRRDDVTPIREGDTCLWSHCCALPNGLETPRRYARPQRVSSYSLWDHKRCAELSRAEPSWTTLNTSKWISVLRSTADESQPEGRTAFVPVRLLRGDYHLQDSTNGHTLTGPGGRAYRLFQQDPPPHTHTCSLAVTMKRVTALSPAFRLFTAPISEKYRSGAPTAPWR